MGEDADRELEILLSGEWRRGEAGATAIWSRVYSKEGVKEGIERRIKRSFERFYYGWIKNGR